MHHRQVMARMCLAAFGLCLPQTGWAQETTKYEYDALGRLKGSTVTGGPSGGTATSITYDAAGNRSNYKVSGAPANSPMSAQVIVVPLNGFTVIPLRRSVF